MQPNNPSNQNQPKPGGYGKRPLWFWIVVYLVVAVVVYGLIYLLFLRPGDAGY